MLWVFRNGDCGRADSVLSHDSCVGAYFVHFAMVCETAAPTVPAITPTQPTPRHCEGHRPVAIHSVRLDCYVGGWPPPVPRNNDCGAVVPTVPAITPTQPTPRHCEGRRPVAIHSGGRESRQTKTPAPGRGFRRTCSLRLTACLPAPVPPRTGQRPDRSRQPGRSGLLRPC